MQCRIRHCIDDATRVVPFAAFAFSENTAAFLPRVQTGPPAQGTTGSTLRRQRIRLPLPPACPGCAPNSASHSSTPGPTSPPGRGKIERYFRTVRGSWLAHLDLAAIDGLDALNRRLWAWVEGEYHQKCCAQHFW